MKKRKKSFNNKHTDVENLGHKSEKWQEEV